ncbi:adenylate/guanylate cyclase domain-containing protein [Okeania hirsuta]|uniref:adenylate/guanylate cyclase domain-containing protein n=1 Tax=Okeania TaxID=1458928 RepID=UPI0026B433F8
MLIGPNGASPVRFRCGIHQGNAVVGMFSGAERSDYTAIGPSVNIAARLQEAAEPNTILVSQTVANYVDSREVKKSGYLKLKGIDQEVLGFVVSRDSIT